MLPFFAILSLFPRDKNLWAYGEGPTNSVLPLLKYAREQDTKKHVYITPFDSQVSRLRNEGIPVFKQHSFFGCYYIARAKVHVISRRTIEDLNKRLSRGALVVNLFHGILRPFVTVAFGSNLGKPQWKINKNKAKMKRLYGRYLLLCSSSELTQQLQSQNFLRDDISTMPIVGMPRLDRLFSKKTDRSYIINNISKSLKKIDTIFAYMPTVRNYNNWDGGINFKKMNEFLLNNNSALIIRPHRLSKDFIFLDNSHYSNIFVSTSYFKEWSDAIDELVGVDILISDHSSLGHEFLITGRPVLPYFPDWNKFIEVSKIYPKFESELPSNKIDNFDDLLDSMNCVIHKNYSYNKYRKIRRKYHFFQDGNSSKRVYESINKHLK